MQTAEETSTSLSDLLKTGFQLFYPAAVSEGYTFESRKGLGVVVVKVSHPVNETRYILFEDHRTENPHGEKPHVCNTWHKSLGVPLAFTMGDPLAEGSPVCLKALQAAAVMCITQCQAYQDMKAEIFHSSL